LRPVLRAATEAERAEAARILNEETAYVEAALQRAGVNPNAPFKVKARALAGQEQHILVAERARIASALDRLEERRQALLRGEKPQAPKPPEAPTAPKAETPETPATEAAPVPEIGDTVNIVSGAERIIATPKPVKIRNILEDERYGTYVFIEGSETGFPIWDVEIVTKGEKPVAKPTVEKEIPLDQQVKADKAKEAIATEGRVYTYYEVTKAIATSLKAAGKGRVPLQRILKDYLPGMSRNQLQPFLDRMVEERNIAIVKNEIFWKKITPDEKEAQTLKMNERKVESARSVLDEAYPNLAKAKLYYVEALRDYFDRFQLSTKGFSKYINQLVQEGKARVWDESTDVDITLSPSVFDNPELTSGLLVQFKDATKAKGELPSVTGKKRESARGKLRKGVQPLTEAEKAKATADLAAVGTKSPLPETPPTERSALTTQEISKIETEMKAVEERMLKRLNAMLPQLPPETADSIRAALSRIDRDSSDLVQLYDAAVQCLLKP
jgi:hypothetical protein